MSLMETKTHLVKTNSAFVVPKSVFVPQKRYIEQSDKLFAGTKKESENIKALSNSINPQSG